MSVAVTEKLFEPKVAVLIGEPFATVPTHEARETPPGASVHAYEAFTVAFRP